MCDVLSVFDLALTSVTFPASFVPFGSSVPSGNFTALVVLASTVSPAFALFESIRLASSAFTRTPAPHSKHPSAHEEQSQPPQLARAKYISWHLLSF
jgi:hypothetical protein